MTKTEQVRIANGKRLMADLAEFKKKNGRQMNATEKWALILDAEKRGVAEMKREA